MRFNHFDMRSTPRHSFSIHKISGTEVGRCPVQTWCDDGRRGTRAIVCWTIVCWTIRRTTEASQPLIGERTLTLHERMGEWARAGPLGVESEAGDMAARGLGSRTARAPGTGPSVPPPPQAPRQARRDSGSRWDTLDRHSGGEMLTMMFQSFTLTFQSHKFTFALKRDERLRPLSEEMRSPLACRPEVGRAGSE